LSISLWPRFVFLREMRKLCFFSWTIGYDPLLSPFFGGIHPPALLIQLSFVYVIALVSGFGGNKSFMTHDVTTLRHPLQIYPCRDSFCSGRLRHIHSSFFRSREHRRRSLPFFSKVGTISTCFVSPYMPTGVAAKPK